MNPGPRAPGDLLVRIPRELRSCNVRLILFSLLSLPVLPLRWLPSVHDGCWQIELLRSYLRPGEPMKHRNRQMRYQFGRRWLRRLSKWFNL